MAGKRPRQIQRTTSMSQLGGSIRFSHGLNANAGAPLRGHSCPPKQEFCHTSTDPCPEAVEVAALPLDIEEHVSSMVIDGSAGERPSSRKICSGSVTGPSSHRATVLGAEALGSLGTHEGGLSTHPRGKDCQISHLRRARLDAGGSVRPAHFLDVCYFCSKLLGHGRDVFIYRGDKAFCSVECRHLQIMADERREKGALTGASDVSANTTQMSDASNANHVETVAAA